MQKKFIKLLTLLIAISNTAFAQRNIQIVSTKEGKNIEGCVLKFIPKENVQIKITNGDTITIPENEITKIETFKRKNYLQPLKETGHWDFDLMTEFSKNKQDFKSAGISFTAFYKINHYLNIGAGTEWRLTYFSEKEYEKVIVSVVDQESNFYKYEKFIETEREKDYEYSTPIFGAIKYDILPSRKASPYIAMRYGVDFYMSSQYFDWEIGFKYKFKNNRALQFSIGSSKFDLWYSEGDQDYRLNKNLFSIKLGYEL